MTQLPPDWKWSNLGQLSFNVGEYGSGAAALHYNPTLPRYVRVTDITGNGRLDPNSHASITKADAVGYYLKTNDLLFARSGATVGKTYLYDEADGDCAHAGYVIKFSLNPDLCFPEFVAQWTRSQFYWRWIGNTFRQGAQPNINAAEYRKLPVPATSVAEQSRIAAVLDTVDEAIAKTEAVIAKLRQVCAGLLHDLLTRGLDPHGQLRDPIAHPEQFKDSLLGQIPKEWTVRNCQSLCREIVVGIVVKPAQYYVEDGVPVLRSANIREGGIQLSDLVFISPESNIQLSKSMLHTDDVVTVRTGYPGTTCVVPSHLDGANCVDLIISRPGSGIVPKFLALWVNSSFGKDQVLRVQGGLAQQHFNVGEMKTLLVARPEPDEQKAIVERLEALDSQIEVTTAEQGKLSVLKSGLMTDLLTGRVRVPAGAE